MFNLLSTRIPGLFLESCFPAHTCLACTASWGYSIPEGDSGACRVSLVGPAPQHPQNQQGWAGAVMGSAGTLRSPSWSTATGLPVDEPRGPICRSAPSAQGPQLKAAPDGMGWPWLQPLHSTFETPPQSPEVTLGCTGMELAPSPAAKPQEWEYIPKALTNSIPLSTSIIKTINNTSSSIHP